MLLFDAILKIVFLIEARLVLDMDGIDGNMAIFGDWAAFNPSPRTFMSEFFNEDVVPRPILDFGEYDSQSSSITLEFEKNKPPISFEEEEKKMGLDYTSYVSSELMGLNCQKSCFRGFQNEIMAAMVHFNMLKVNMSQSDKENIMYESDSTQSGKKNLISSVPEECSSSMLFSPGVSPTSMMESLDYFSNSMVVSAIDHEQALPNNNAFLKENLKLLESYERKKKTQDIVADQKASHSLAVNESPLPTPSDDHQDGETGLEVEFSSVPVSDPANDGYNWRKYGQKQLKGCEFPCSYHKCTHPNCPVKKKVERSLQGHITEIIYKGSHNHPKPTPNSRSGIPSSTKFHVPQTNSSNHPGAGANFKGNPSRATTQNGFTGPEWSDGLGGSSSASFVELGDPSNLLKGSRLELLEAIDASCPISDDKEENGATHGSFSDECDIEEEMESKRRKQELCPISRRATSRTMRDPRIVVQIPSEFDIPDDGYRWRKYGQKVVKGNQNPRSYYKCTHRGCSVRKQVERASDDLKSVMSTYEGRHNHDVPSARNSNRAYYSPSKPTVTAALQLPGFYSRSEFAQNNFLRFENRAPINTFGLLGSGQQLGQTNSFSFGIDQLNLVSLRSFVSGSIEPFKGPFFSPMHQNMDHHFQVNSGNVIPKREPKEEPM